MEGKGVVYGTNLKSCLSRFYFSNSHVIKTSLPNQMYSAPGVQNCTFKGTVLLGGSFLNSPIIVIFKPLILSYVITHQ